MKNWAAPAAVFLAAILVLGLGEAGRTQPFPFGGAKTAPGRIAFPGLHVDLSPVPCHPDTTLPEALRVLADGTIVSANPAAAEIVEDQVVTTPDDLAADFPGILDGNDGALANMPCDSTLELLDTLPPMVPPPGSLVPPPFPMPPIPPPPTNLPPITFSSTSGLCLADAAIPCKGPPLNCALPFCGRDIIFVHGFINETLKETIEVKLGLGGDPRALANWPQSPQQYTAVGGFFRDWAYERWDHFIRIKLAQAYANAGVARGPRFLITAWGAHQRLEVGAHAVLSQIVDAIQNDSHVMTVGLSGLHSIVPATPANGFPAHTFCDRGCIIISHSTGGPLVAAALAIASTPNVRPWRTPSLGYLATYIKGHVAFHPALSGSQLAYLGVGVGQLGGPSCTQAVDFINAMSQSGPFIGSTTPACAALNTLSQSSLIDLMPAVMNTLWRPMIQYPALDVRHSVPSVIVAGAHPTKNLLVHFVTPALAGYDDGVVVADSELGRPWAPGIWPLSINLGAWGLIGAKYFDRGSAISKATAYFVDQNLEIGHQPLAHAAAPNPYLSPTGMILKSVTLGQVPAASSGMRNYYSFLQSASTHFFPHNVGGGPNSPATDANDSCPAGSFNYWRTGTNQVGIPPWPGVDASVNEESRAVFDSSVYTNIGRNLFAVAEIGTGPGVIPVLSPRLKTAIEGESTGRYIRIRFKALNIDRKIWIWKREYMRMRDWRCRDEIDYTLDFAFRK